MLSALLYLRFTSQKNWLLSRARRLRQPKYLAGFLAGAAWFWFFFLRRFFAIGPGLSPGPRSLPVAALVPFTSELAPELHPMLVALAAAGLFVIVLLGWVLPVEKPGLAFSEAEVAFLFPAPVTRRTLIHYKLVSSQLGVLFTALVFTAFSNRLSFLGGNLGTHFVGMWVILSTLNLHFMAAAFVISRLMEEGLSASRRRLWLLGALGLAAVLAALLVWRDLRGPRLDDFASFRTFAQYLQPLVTTGLVPWLLLPFKAVVSPFLAPDWRALGLALGPALLVMAANYGWVLQAETSFEEASLALAERRATRIAAARSGNYRLGPRKTKGRPGPFRLAPAGGRPEIAFLWKNLLSTRPYLNPRTFLVLAVLIAAGGTHLAAGSEQQRTIATVVGMLSLMMAGYTVLFGPQFARQDLRSDLSQADILKTYPLQGWQVVLGELLTPVAILTGVIWLLLLTAAVTLGALPQRNVWLAPGLRATAAVCVACVTPVLCTLQLMVPNAATLLFPSWAQTARTRGGGLDVMGQRLIFVFGQVLVIVLALLPAAVLGGLLWFAAHWLLAEAGSTAVATLGVLGVLAAELALGLLWLGRRFEKLDLSIETVR